MISECRIGCDPPLHLFQRFKKSLFHDNPQQQQQQQDKRRPLLDLSATAAGKKKYIDWRVSSHAGKEKKYRCAINKRDYESTSRDRNFPDGAYLHFFLLKTRLFSWFFSFLSFLEHLLAAHVRHCPPSLVRDLPARENKRKIKGGKAFLQLPVFSSPFSFSRFFSLILHRC